MKVKKLFIIRHAKAEEHTFTTTDYNRNLIAKGINRAKNIAPLLKNKYQDNDKIIFLSSSANRAVQTAEIFAKSLDFPTHSILLTKKIYEAHYQDILTEINKIPDHIDTVFIFGHNPGLSDLTNYLCNSYITLNTSAVAELDIEEGLEFAMLSAGTASLKMVFSE